MRRTVVEIARRQGCTCQPAVTLTTTGVRCAHDDRCPLADAGQTTALAIRTKGGDVHLAYDLTTAIDIAIKTGAMVMSTGEGVIVVPDQADTPPWLPEFCDVTTICRPDGGARIYSLADEIVEGLERQLRGEP